MSNGCWFVCHWSENKQMVQSGAHCVSLLDCKQRQLSEQPHSLAQILYLQSAHTRLRKLWGYIDPRTHKPNHHQQVYFNSWSVVESVLKSNKGQENKTLNLHWILKTTYELVRAHLSLVFTSTTYWVEYVELRGTRGKTCLPTLVTFTFSTVEAVNASTVLWMILIVMIHKKHSMDDCMSYHQWYQSVLKSLEVPTL